MNALPTAVISDLHQPAKRQRGPVRLAWAAGLYAASTAAFVVLVGGVRWLLALLQFQ